MNYFLLHSGLLPHAQASVSGLVYRAQPFFIFLVSEVFFVVGLPRFLPRCLGFFACRDSGEVFWDGTFLAEVSCDVTFSRRVPGTQFCFSRFCPPGREGFWLTARGDAAPDEGRSPRGFASQNGWHRQLAPT